MTKVGFIGLGAMGSRIAKRLSLQQPYFNVHIYDMNPNAINSLLKETKDNVFGSSSLNEVVSDSNYIISCLPRSTHVLETIEKCFKSNRNPFAVAGCVWMDCSSGDAKTSQFISNTYFANDNNLHFMDTPVSGGPFKAEKGTVACMIGCDEQNQKIFEKCRDDILQHISSNPTRVGDVGAGHALKCINNLLNVSNLLILSEGLKCVDQYGIDIKTALNVINASSGRSLMSEERYPKHILEKNYFYDFQLGLMKKDVQNAVDLMNDMTKQDSSTQFIIANKVNELLNDAVDKFGYEADYTEAGRLFLDLKDVEQTK